MFAFTIVIINLQAFILVCREYSSPKAAEEAGMFISQHILMIHRVQASRSWLEKARSLVSSEGSDIRQAQSDAGRGRNERHNKHNNHHGLAGTGWGPVCSAASFFFSASGISCLSTNLGRRQGSPTARLEAIIRRTAAGRGMAWTGTVGGPQPTSPWRPVPKRRH